MNYPQILSPVLNFLHCPTPQAWIVQARDPQNLPLLLTDHLICELKAAQTALLLVRKYVADKSGADALLAWLQPYEAFAFRQGPEPDFVALHRQISKSAMPQTDDPWGRQLIDRMVLLVKEELHHFWQVREVMQCSGSQKARTRSKKDATPCCVAFYVNYWPECSDLGYG